jgi:hypothetical protein
MRNWRLCKNGSQPEWVEQTIVANFIRTQYKDLLWTATAGGIRTSFSQAKRNKMCGYNKGCPDIFVFEPRNGKIGLAIEMKRKTGGQLSPEQKWWLTELEKRNWRAIVCNGADEAIAEIDKYLRGKTI